MSDETEFLRLVNEHRRIIHRLTTLYANDADDRKDLEQETLPQAWKGWPTFRGDAKFSTWLYRIALNTILSWKRRPRHERHTANSPTLTAPVGMNDDAQRLYLAMRQLTEIDRALLTLHLEGHDQKEIGQIIGLTANNVRVRIHRTKERLTQLLKP